MLVHLAKDIDPFIEHGYLLGEGYWSPDDKAMLLSQETLPLIFMEGESIMLIKRMPIGDVRKYVLPFMHHVMFGV